MEAAASTCRT